MACKVLRVNYNVLSVFIGVNIQYPVWHPDPGLNLPVLFIEQRNKNGPQQIDALDYWVKCESMFPTLSKVACDIAVVPASYAPIERIFSTAGDSCFGKRNRLTSTNLEREVLIKKNKVYLNIENNWNNNNNNNNN